MKNRLIIAPHVDDDVLGCGGIMDKNTTVLYCGLNEAGIASCHNRPHRDIRLKEADSVKKLLGHEYILLENKVNQYEITALIGQIESVVNSLSPAEIYIPHPSYNQDHQVVYDACLVALRPHDKNFFVKKALVYEQPHAFLWGRHARDFAPSYFIPIDIELKIKAYLLMKTQVRSFRSPETITSIAQLRGAQSNHKHAEAFEVLRWTD